MEVAVNVSEREMRKKSEPTIKTLKMIDDGRNEKTVNKSRLDET